jgi:proteasome lid subunit RPN8/RPN11
LKERLRRIRADLEIETCHSSILVNPLGSDDWTDTADVIIDTTASEMVLGKLELKRFMDSEHRVPVVSMAVGHRAERGMVVLASTAHSGGPFDVARRAKLEIYKRLGFEALANEFWPAPDAPRRSIFQPEPGCSDSTYMGSEADAAVLTGMMLNQAAIELACMDNATASAHFFTQPHALASSDEKAHASFHWQPDRISRDPHAGYEIRIAESAWSDMLAWVERLRRRVGPDVETGGLLFGERDDAIRVIWVSEASGPPPDSEASEAGFLCGILGTAEANAEKKRRTRGTVQYIGMWHSHPGSSPLFSMTDLAAMEKLVTATNVAPSKSLLCILGITSPVPTIGTYVFSSADFAHLREGKLVRQCVIITASPRPKPRHIGLALSGGGSRAIAFHLGCLRALHDRGILPQVAAISAVSGGAVIAAMYAYSQDSFEDFEARTVTLLRSGLVGPWLRQVLLPSHLLASLSIHAIAGTAALGAAIMRRVLSIRSGNASNWCEKIHAPFYRSVSRTTAFEGALRHMLFHDLALTDVRRDNIDIVLNGSSAKVTL